MPSHTSLGIDSTLPNPPLYASPNPYQAIAIWVGHTGCNGGLLSLVNFSITRNSENQRYTDLTVLGSPFSAASPLLGDPVIWTKYSSASPPKLSSNI